MPNCAALSCTNRLIKGSGKSFHCFPSDETQTHKWLVNMKREDLEPSRHLNVCSDHFIEECFDRTGQTTRLRAGAVPTLFFFKERDLMRGNNQKNAVKFPFKQLRSGKLLFAPPMYPPLPESPCPPEASSTSQDSKKEQMAENEDSEESDNYSVYEIAFAEDEEQSGDRGENKIKTRDDVDDCFLPPKLADPSLALDPKTRIKKIRINKLKQHDHPYSIGDNPVVLKHKLDKACERLAEMRKKQLRVTYTRNRRLTKRVQCLTKEVQELRYNQQAIDETLEFLESLEYRPDFFT